MANRHSPEVRARAVRMALEHQSSYETQGAAMAAIAPKIGCIPQTLAVWLRMAAMRCSPFLGQDLALFKLRSAPADRVALL